jgi:hypothetical protein
MSGPTLEVFVNRRVVLDTTGPMIYIGLLEAFSDRGYWLLEADVHDRSEGHSTKEMYISEAQALERSGARRSNRKRVFVDRQAVISVSALDDISMDEQTDERGVWTS